MKSKKFIALIFMTIAFSAFSFIPPEENLKWCIDLGQGQNGTGYCKNAASIPTHVVLVCSTNPGYENQPKDCIGNLLAPMPY